MIDNKNIRELDDAELIEISGGKSGKKSKPQRTNEKCLQCQIRGKMSEQLYKVDGDIKFCTEMFHVYKKGAYIKRDEKAVKAYLAR